jgi:dTDP-4-amino-4,6-dideoxygalactose transaminase
LRDRDRVRVKLQQQGVGVGVHYPVPLHRQPAYKHLAISDGALPVTNRVASEILSLPMYPELSPDQIDAIGKVVIEVLEA